MSSLRLCDVGPRDGLQNESVTLAPAVRAELARRLAAAGLPDVEAASFVRADRVPQMAGAAEVVAALPADSPTSFSALVLNDRGAQLAIEAGVRDLHMAVMATETFSQRNCGMSTDEGLNEAAAVIDRAHAAGGRVTATVSVAFGCPFEGPVDPDRVLGLAERLVADGADALFLADTIGSAVPTPVATLVRRVCTLGVPVGIHLHNTRNTGYLNAFAAIEAGATLLEASIGGTGGCPFAPNATGNIATEDLVYMLEREGMETGVDLGALIETAGWLEQRLGSRVPGLLHVAGPFPADGHPLTSRGDEGAAT